LKGHILRLEMKYTTEPTESSMCGRVGKCVCQTSNPYHNRSHVIKMEMPPDLSTITPHLNNKCSILNHQTILKAAVYRIHDDK